MTILRDTGPDSQPKHLASFRHRLFTYFVSTIHLLVSTIHLLVSIVHLFVIDL